MSVDEFSPEQRVSIAILWSNGCPDPEGYVRQHRIDAYNVGAHLMPILREIARSLGEMLRTVDEVLGKGEA